MRAVAGPLPKSLVPVAGRPFLSLVLDRLDGLGVTRVHLCLGRGAAEILELVRNRRAGRPRVSSTVEPGPLGIAGALRFALDRLEERFAMLYGDVYPTVPLAACWQRFLASPADLQLSACPAGRSPEAPNILLDGPAVAAYVKGADRPMSHVDVGLTMLARRAVAALPSGRFLTEADLFGPLVDRGRATAFVWEHPSRQVGDPAHHAAFVDWWSRQLSEPVAGGGAEQ
jgi:D-glycero-D-manno-heptose 1,7-bisphosphate phosphatase